MLAIAVRAERPSGLRRAAIAVDREVVEDVGAVVVEGEQEILGKLGNDAGGG